MVKKMSVGTPEQDNVAIEFVKAYYGIFDSDSRQNLMEAYHDEALMSMSASFPAYTQVQSKGFGKYIQESRNLLRITHGDKRRKLLRHGKLGIVSCLADLPK